MIELAERKNAVVQGVEPEGSHQVTLPRMTPAKRGIRQGLGEMLSQLARRIQQIRPTEPTASSFTVHERPRRGFD